MKKTLLLYAGILICLCCQAQKAAIQGKIAGADNVAILRLTNAMPDDFFEENLYKISPDKNGGFHVAFQLEQPEIMIMAWQDTLARKNNWYNLFLSPGDNLTFNTTPGQPAETIKVTGTGANNNQLLKIGGFDSLDILFDHDTLPDRVYTYLLQKHQQHRQILKDYIQQHKPSAAFVSAWKNNLQYEMATQYYGFEHNNAFGIREAYERNKDQWEIKREAIFSVIKLSNDEAITAPNYTRLLQNYLLRTKEALWNQAYMNRDAFLREWYGEDTAYALQQFSSDMENDLRQRIIEKTFTGKAKEYLYAVLITGALSESSIANLETIYQEFKKQFPQSRYVPLLEEPVSVVSVKMQQPLTEKMHFVKDGDKINTWEEVLAQFKGQTVLLDMWGTWCGPCREELEKNGAALKKHFAGKPLQFLYIANYDQTAGDKWKKLIAYFNLEGYHILANGNLTKDIMTKVKGTGYPTYVVIHKDGSFELSKAGYPMDREKLVQQLEEAMK